MVEESSFLSFLTLSLAQTRKRFSFYYREEGKDLHIFWTYWTTPMLWSISSVKPNSTTPSSTGTQIMVFNPALSAWTFRWKDHPGNKEMSSCHS
tara:strand:- start:119 stop:400 length:282 start_codon:yes stop_codon:yes gene_type:complete